MMRKCCFCVDLRLGCLIVGVIRLFLWLVVLLAGFYTAIHIFSPDNHGMFHYSARINIERNCKESLKAKVHHALDNYVFV